MRTNYFICNVLVFFFISAMVLRAQTENDPFVFNPGPIQPLGTITNESPVTITFDAIYVGDNPNTFFINIGPLQYFNPWITSVDPDGLFTVRRSR